MCRSPAMGMARLRRTAERLYDGGRHHRARRRRRPYLVRDAQGAGAGCAVSPYRGLSFRRQRLTAVREKVARVGKWSDHAAIRLLPVIFRGYTRAYGALRRVPRFGWRIE